MSPEKLLRQVQKMHQIVESGETVVVERVFDAEDRRWLNHHAPLVAAWLERLTEAQETVAEAEEDLEFTMATLDGLALALQVVRQKPELVPQEADPAAAEHP